MDRKKFQAVAATTKIGKPTLKQIADNGGLRGEAHDYDHKRPSRPVQSRYCGK